MERPLDKQTVDNICIANGLRNAEEQKIIEEQMETTNEIIKSFCFAGLARTMNQFNKKGNGNKPQENNG